MHDTIANSNAQLPYAPHLTENLATPDDHWRFTFAGENLTNKVYLLGVFYIFNGLIASSEWPSLPRRWTFSAQYRY